MLGSQLRALDGSSFVSMVDYTPGVYRILVSSILRLHNARLTQDFGVPLHVVKGSL